MNPRLLHALSYQYRKEQTEAGQKALEVENKLSERIQKVGKDLIKLGFIKHGFPRIDGGFDRRVEYPDKVEFMFYKEGEITDWTKGQIRVTVPAEWIFCNDDSFHKEVLEKVRVQQENNEKMLEMNGLQDRINKIRKGIVR